MATYYVSTYGNDGDNGLGPDASDSTNRPWRTIQKAIGASGIASGDTVYIAPGVYPEQVLVGLAPAAETLVYGDYLNLQGFKRQDGVRIEPDPIVLTNYLGGDEAVPTTGYVLSCQSKSYFRFENISIVACSSAGTPYIVDLYDAVGLTFVNCMIEATGSASLRGLRINRCLNFTLDRCFIHTKALPLELTASSTASASRYGNWDIKNCVIISRDFDSINITGVVSGGGQGYGCRITNCTLFCAIRGVYFFTSTTTWDATDPVVVTGCNIIAGTCLIGLATAPSSEDFNFLCGQTIRTNVNAGASSKTHRNIEPRFHFVGGIAGHSMKPFGEPVIGTPLTQFSMFTSSGTDALGRPRRQSTQGQTLGAFETHDNGTYGVSADGYTYSLKLVGSGDQEFIVPVKASPTAISVRGYYDSNYAGADLPQVVLFSGSHIGVDDSSAVMTVGSGTWETMTLPTFTPDSAGAVKVRLHSRSTGTNSETLFDSLSVQGV